MDPMKIIQYVYFLNIGGVVSGVYLVILFVILGETEKAMRYAATTALELAATLWFRKRYDLWP